MVKSAIIKAQTEVYYGVEKPIADDLETLGDFLINEVKSEAEDIKTMLLQNGSFTKGFRRSEFKKNYIAIYKYPNHTRPTCTVPAAMFFDLLEQWKTIYHQDPSEIIITFDDTREHFTIQTMP